MIYITIAITILFFLTCRDRFHLSSSKAIGRQMLIMLVWLMILIANTFINWAYFKQYDGTETTGYKIAYAILNTTGYGILACIILIILSISLQIKKNKD